jgi:hypothetical protein
MFRKAILGLVTVAVLGSIAQSAFAIDVCVGYERGNGRCVGIRVKT